MGLLNKFANTKKSAQQLSQRDQEIMQCNTLAEMLDVLKKYHNMDKELGPVAKELILQKVIPGLDKALNAIGV